MNRTLKTMYWTDPKVRSFSPNAKYLGAYLCTAPESHLSGVFFLSTSVIAENTGLTHPAIEDALDELAAQGFIARDTGTCEVWVIHMFRHQSSRSPAIRRCVEKHLVFIHSKDLKARFAEFYQFPLRPPGEGRKTLSGWSEDGSVTVTDTLRGSTPNAKRKRTRKAQAAEDYTPWAGNQLTAAFARGAADAFVLGVVEKGLAIRLNTLQAQAEKHGVTYDDIEAAGEVAASETWRDSPITAAQLAKANVLFDLVAKAKAGPKRKRSRADEFAARARQLELEGR